ncbi:MAG: acyl carrier protein [Actinomycetota bacterium]|jgi:acyl carrier protein|nr:acyl carrier protein [Actinomycetota bacterium]
MADVEDRIRMVLGAHARLPRGVEELDDTADLYAAGMTSHASVNVMLGIEDEFDVEFPEHLLRKDTFESVAAIRAALEELLGG